MSAESLLAVTEFESNILHLPPELHDHITSFLDDFGEVARKFPLLIENSATFAYKYVIWKKEWIKTNPYAEILGSIEYENYINYYTEMTEEMIDIAIDNGIHPKDVYDTRATNKSTAWLRYEKCTYPVLRFALRRMLTIRSLSSLSELVLPNHLKSMFGMEKIKPF